MRTSYSAIETYKSCPQRYKFQNIDKIRVPKSFEAVFGTLVHSALHAMFKKDPLFPTLDEVIQFYRENWPGRETFDAVEKHDAFRHALTPAEEKIYFDEGIKMLKRFYEKNAPWNFTVVDLESRFEVPLRDEKTGQIHIIAGIIDRVDKNGDGEFEIIDYKTSKRMPSQKMLDNNLQLSVYSLALQTRWPTLTPQSIKLSLYFLKHGEKLSTGATQEKNEKTKSTLLETINEILGKSADGKDFEPMPGPLCNWCSYRPVCPAWSHLYRKSKNKERLTPDKIQEIIKEYFELNKSQKDGKAKLAELQQTIRTYMEQEHVTRVFGDSGVISKKLIKRYAFNLEAVKALLSPLGKWEEILKADETKLNKILKEIPEEVREAVMAARRVTGESIRLTASKKNQLQTDTH